MQNIATTLFVLLFVTAIGTLFFFLTTKSIEYTMQQEVQAAEDLQSRIDEVLAQPDFRLSDFIAQFGEPSSVNNVDCQGDRCVRARWDLSTRFVKCWRRLEIVINDESQQLVYYEIQELSEAEVEQNGQKAIVCLYN